MVEFSTISFTRHPMESSPSPLAQSLGYRAQRRNRFAQVRKCNVEEDVRVAELVSNSWTPAFWPRNFVCHVLSKTIPSVSRQWVFQGLPVVAINAEEHRIAQTTVGIEWII